MANYKTLMELTAFEGDVQLTDQILISRSENNTNSDYVSYHTPVQSFAAALSDAIKDSLLNYMGSHLGDLSNCNHDQLEYNGDRKLTSYVHVENNGRIAADRFHVISALNWNADKKITSVETVDLVKLSSDIFKDVLEYLKTKGLADGVKFDDKTNNKGMIIGQLSGINSSRGFVDIYSGDPSQLVNVQKIATTGNEIGSITYYGGNTVTLQNGVVVQPVNYNRTDQCGTEIFTFNGTSIKNNLSVTQKKNVGDVIANINGTNIYDGLTVDNRNSSGDVIAYVNNHEIKNGCVVSEVQTTGKPIFKFNNTQLYNNVDVADMTQQKGLKIAVVNGENLYNGVVITTNQTEHQTYINGEKILGGIVVGDVTQNTTTGNVIATICTSSKPSGMQIYNGVDQDSLRKYTDDSIARLQAQINNLKTIIDNNDKNIYAYVNSNFLFVNKETLQTVTGPVKYNITITGNITNADYAVKANWA